MIDYTVNLSAQAKALYLKEQVCQAMLESANRETERFARRCERQARHYQEIAREARKRLSHG